METRIGRVTHYFAHLEVAGVCVEAEGLKVGDTIRIAGHTTDFTQEVSSMQLEHASIREAKVGEEIGLRVVERVREHDVVSRILPEKE